VLTLTDARVGLSAYGTRIYQLEKTINASAREDWVVSFGGLPPSGANEIRRLNQIILRG
jgi:hypothetical protein